MSSSPYLRELGERWRTLVAASLGMAAGYNATLYLSNVFTPFLLAEFHWTKSQYSLAGTMTLFTIVCGPIAGRLVDRFGVRAVATVGVSSAPLLFLAYSVMNGDFRVFLAINAAQVIIMGMLTTSVVYSKALAARFTVARGVALAIAFSAPALLGAFGAPLLTQLMTDHGWRAGYRVMALGSAVAGALALLLLPAGSGTSSQSALSSARTLRRDYRAIFRNPAFRIIIGGMVLCNLPLMMNAVQLKVILLERGLTSIGASWMISLYASAVVVGRLGFGLALDRLSTRYVVAFAMALPALGLLLLASGLSWPLVLGLAVAVLGINTGAEGDIMGFVVMRFFPVEIFSSAIGLVGASVALSAAIGALLLSATLKVTGSYSLFLTTTALAALAGGALFLFLGARPSAAGLPLSADAAEALGRSG